MRKYVLTFICLLPALLPAQINTDRVMTIARNALYFEDYVLSIQYFNQVISAKPYLYDPYFYRGMAKFYLDDYSGAEEDCSSAIQRNPFVVGAYQVRGLSRIRQNKYDLAIEDYSMALKYDPENVSLWHNLALCHLQKKDYEAARGELNRLLEVSPRYTAAFLMRGEAFLHENDTISALNDFDRAIELERFEPNGYSARGMVRLQQGKYAEAEEDLNQAIRLSARNASNYINRALSRFHQNNLRGAMSDYDLALDIDPGNFLGHYNRGLLRAQVGDDNRAIEDFDFVLRIDPDDMMATYNRGILRGQTGDYRGAIEDFTRVIDVYPEFLAGYYQRAEARKKIGDRVGAEQDEFKIMKAQIDQLNNAAQGNVTADNNQAENKEEDRGSKTRKQSDKNVENYRKLVIADDTDAQREYAGTARGRVQDRNVQVRPEPLFALTYYTRQNDLKRNIHYHHYIDDLNGKKLLPGTLLISNQEAPLTVEQVNFHFAQIDKLSAEIEQGADALRRFSRGIDFYLVQNLDDAEEDFTQAVQIDPTFFPAYFMRAVVRYKRLEYRMAEARNEALQLNDEGKPVEVVSAMDYELVKRDLDKVIELAPDFVYAYFNRGSVLISMNNYRGALEDYNHILEVRPDFAEAYYNRGLTHIFLGNNRLGVADLSKAGELGEIEAYNVLKRFSSVED